MTFDKFVNILVTSRVIAPEAISDPDNYDDNCMLENVRAAYRRLTKPTAGMTFGQAIINLKAGKRVARAGWNGKGMFLFLVPGSRITVSEGRPLAAVFPVGAEVDYLPHIDMKTADDKVVPWLASQTDVLAEDWTVVSPEAEG